jgi:hypothetical protein
MWLTEDQEEQLKILRGQYTDEEWEKLREENIWRWLWVDKTTGEVFGEELICVDCANVKYFLGTKTQEV